MDLKGNFSHNFTRLFENIPLVQLIIKMYQIRKTNKIESIICTLFLHPNFKNDFT